MVTDCKSQQRGKEQERRRFGRFASRMPVRTSLDEGAPSKQNGEHIPCSLQLRDFSLGGLRVESPRPLDVNEPVTVSLPPGERHPAVHLTGRVVHCREREDRYEVGIQFRERERDPQRSPYLGLPRLFSMATEFKGTIRREREDEP
jgi:hypothetical protein